MDKIIEMCQDIWEKDKLKKQITHDDNNECEENNYPLLNRFKKGFDAFMEE